MVDGARGNALWYFVCICNSVSLSHGLGESIIGPMTLLQRKKYSIMPAWLVLWMLPKIKKGSYSAAWPGARSAKAKLQERTDTASRC